MNESLREIGTPVYFDWLKSFVGTRKPLSDKQKANKKARRKLTKQSKKRNKK